MAERGHGSWYFDCAVPVLPGRRERLRRGGYPTRREAIAARDALLGDGITATVEGWTMERWLRHWLTTRTRIRPTTLHSYRIHVENNLIPRLGRLRLSELTGRHITDMITTIGATNNRYGRTPTPSTLHRIRAILRSALNAAIREGMLRDNPARYVEVPSPRRPHALVWTVQRVEAWQKTGKRPAVAVWTTEQTATFLGYVAKDRLAVMWWLIALRGLRRGEAAGLRWTDVDLDAGVAMIEQQRIANGHLVTVGPPKTAASRRLIALDRHTIRLLRQHRRWQRAEHRAAGEVWQDSGYVFVAEDGAPLHPDFLTRRFRHLVLELGLPPVRLHDLRHGAASLAHCAGVDLKTVQAQLGHSSVVLTADTYTSVLTDLLAYAAEATAQLVLAAAARNPGHRHGKTKSAGPAEIGSVKRPVTRHCCRDKGSRQSRPRTSHQRPTKIKAV
ncbi:site-specific integrase [Actinoplanes sp. NPDC051346]|uniref:tyrosine-type recombinase/integrase n=1 Tax=Actinoplanes sp. NPDC051346 TaxID=3155048 RepID=UPI0034491EC5